MIKPISCLSIIALLSMMWIPPISAILGKIFRKGETKDQDDNYRPPPVYEIKYIDSNKLTQPVVNIDLTSPANRGIDLLRTGWIVHQGQKIELKDFELKGGSFVWDHDVQSCKDSYVRKDKETSSGQGKGVQPQGRRGKGQQVQAKNITNATKPKKKMKIPIPVMIHWHFSRWSSIQQNQKSLRIRGPASNSFWHLTLPKEDRRQRRETPGVKLNQFTVLDFTNTIYRKAKERTPYVLENDIKCQIKMTLRKKAINSKKQNDPSLIWRRLNINLLIKAEKKSSDDNKALDEQIQQITEEIDGDQVEEQSQTNLSMPESAGDVEQIEDTELPEAFQGPQVPESFTY